MIIFDSIKQKKWTGTGYQFKQGSIALQKNSKISQTISLSDGSYKIKILGRKKTGPGNFNIKLVCEKEKLFDKDIIFDTMNFSEMTFDFYINNDKTPTDIIISRGNDVYGNIEIGKIIIMNDEEKNYKNITAYNDNIVSKQNNPKLLFIVPYNIYGGAEIYIENIINELPNSYEISIICAKPNIIQNRINKKNVYHRTIELTEQLKNYIKTAQPQFIFYYNSEEIYLLLLELKRKSELSSKLIEIYHSDFSWTGALSLVSKREHLFKMIMVSEQVGTKINFEDKVVLPVGINIERFNVDSNKRKELGLSKSDKVIGTVCRLSKEKRVDYILELAKEMSDYKFLIIGDGPERKRLESIATKNVIFTGFRQDVELYLKTMNAFILASRMEGTPISIIEAMAAKISIFSNFVGGIPSIIKDGHSATKISGDNVKEDCEIIRKNFQNINYINNAYDDVIKKHDIKNNIKEFINILFFSKMSSKEITMMKMILPGTYI